MSGKIATFASAPRIRIKIDNVDIAYAVGLSLNVGINLQEVRVLGSFEVQSVEPLTMMPVTGSFQIIRLFDSETIKRNVNKAKARDSAFISNKDVITGKDDKGEPILTNGEVVATRAATGGAFLNNTELAKHLDPRFILSSKSFDIEILIDTPIIKNNKDAWAGATGITMLKVKNCRLTGASANITPNALLTESAEFQGLLAVRYSSEVGGINGVASAVEDQGNLINELG
jgi:hypothetical protein